MQETLSLQQIDFYQSGKPILQDINLTLYNGKIIGLLGVNGAGKSTTLKIAAGVLIPSNGKIRQQPQATIGYLPEVAPLVEKWSVKGFLKHICNLHDIPKNKHKIAVDKVIEKCHLDKVFKQTIASLSKGNRQRVAIAQAIIHQPNILILDEPTSGLDPQQINNFRNLIQQIKPTTSILLSSHIIQEINALCDEVSIIHQGNNKKTLLLHKMDKIIIEFYEPVPENKLRKLPEWQSGTGVYHYFSVSSKNNQDNLIKHLLAMQLSIYRINGNEKILENTFLQTIRQSND